MIAFSELNSQKTFTDMHISTLIYNKLKFIFTILLSLSLVSCKSIGTIELPKNRIGFSDAMLLSEEQQLLLNIVRMHYEDRPYFVSVESITTSNSLVGNTGANYNYSSDPSGSVSNNLNKVGSSLQIVSESLTNSFSKLNAFGVAPNITYSDSPTISYSPLQGEKFTRNILTPISIRTLDLLLNAGWLPERIMRILLEEVEDYNNPSFTFTDTIPEFKQFQVLVKIIKELFKFKMIYFDLGSIEHISIDTAHTTDIPATPCLDMIIKRKYRNSPTVKQLYRMLGIHSRPGVIHFTDHRRLAAANTQDNIIEIKTRSFGSVLDYLSNGVQFNPEAVKKGLVVSPRYPDGTIFNYNQITRGMMRINVSTQRPHENISVVVSYRNHWYWISDNDFNSKRTIALVEQVFNLQSGDLTGQTTPVLTIPVK